jgi:AhpD family alkylhydroperoxidase
MDSRIFTSIEFYRHLPGSMRAMPVMARARRKGLISKAFVEKIMLAVTQVNGCRYCSWFHTRVALKEGVPKSEIHTLLGGEFEGADEDEMLALLYAQHYADTGGKPEEEHRRKLFETYGREKARGIEASIKAITVGNIYGIAFDGLMRRLKGKEIKGSKLQNELGIVFGSLFMFPVALFQGLLTGKDSTPV